jgi:hypothetical protein
MQMATMTANTIASPRQRKHPQEEFTMTRKDLAKRVKQRPFVPFRLVLTEGTSYEVRHPEQIMVARDSIVIGVPSENDQEDFFDTTVLADLFHVVKLEPLPARTVNTPTPT